MKNLFSNTIVFMAIVLFFTSCEKSLYEENIQNETKKISVKNVSLSDLDITTMTKINKKISDIKKLAKKTSDQNKFEYNSSLDLYIDTENGKLVNDNGKLFYTFPSFRKDEEKLENIVFNIMDNDEMETYLVKYNIKPEEFNNLSPFQIQNLNPEYQKLMFNNWYVVCVESQEAIDVTPIEHGDLTGNFGYELVWQTTGSVCMLIDLQGDNANNGGVGSQGGSNTTDNNIGTAGNNISTSPSVSPYLVEVKNFIKNLTSNQQSWYNSQSPEIQQIINDAVINDVLLGDETASQILNSMMNNDGYSGDGFQGDSDDENGDYSGPKEHIPSTIVLDDGSSVSVTFGTTSSDGQSADNQVANSLVEAVRQALNQANSNLGPSRKITSIYVMATTNGSHSPTSNHTKGTAVDISRINGVKIAELGPNDQVQALQNGFDGYNGIRENFGPHFKHKTYPDGSVNLNFPVGGHGDHIHASVQN